MKKDWRFLLLIGMMVFSTGMQLYWNGSQYLSLRNIKGLMNAVKSLWIIMEHVVRGALS